MGLSHARIVFDEVGTSSEEPHEDKGFGRGEKEVKIDLNDEPRSLLDSLNAWREKVAEGELPGFLGFLAL